MFTGGRPAAASTHTASHHGDVLGHDIAGVLPGLAVFIVVLDHFDCVVSVLVAVQPDHNGVNRIALLEGTTLVNRARRGGDW